MFSCAKRNATPQNGRDETNVFFFYFSHRSLNQKPPRRKPKKKKKKTSLAAPEFIYVRVKRRAATYFLRVEPTERVRSLKLKLEELVQKGPEEIRLVKLGGGSGGGGAGGGRSGGGSDAAGAASTSRQEPLDDEDARLADVGIGNDDVLALCFKEGGSGWEKVEIYDDGNGGGGGTAD